MTYLNPNSDMGPSYWAYIKQFECRVTVKLGPAYTAEFKEFNNWCEERLGTKYKDWFIASNTKNKYTLFARSSKWTTFLMLTWIDKIVE